ncbi:MAG TPA: type I restriction endonuclease subunit R [Bacteroidales bacterium]|nr:type I restriction endonuclease subunit R [Bacteroidales bacterium]
MKKITETDIELLAIEHLEQLGYKYVYGPDITCDGIKPERESYQDVLLTERFKNAIGRINPTIPEIAKEQALKTVLRVTTPDLLQTNENFHVLLTEGIEVEYRINGDERGDKVMLIDYDKPENNEFVVCNQFTVIENNENKRPDVVLFVNGLPLVVIELKNPADEKATVKKAFTQLQNYKTAIPSLFQYNAFLVASDGLDAKAGTISSAYSRFLAWKTTDGQNEASHLVCQMLTLIAGMLDKKTMLDLIRHFIVFEKDKKEDLKTGIITVETIKKIAGYHQYYAVNKAVNTTTIATTDKGDRRGGVVWHTQGSGKSLSMVFYTGKLVLALNNPTVVVITDRNDLDDQLFDTFASCRQLLRQDPQQADSRDELKKLLKVAAGGIVFTTIQKFFPEDMEDKFPQLSNRSNIIVIADEAHRTQYGFEAKTKYITDKNGTEIGSKIAYGFAKHMRDALPNATFIGFTGTPVELTDRNTKTVFGEYIDIYDIQQAVEDGATVRIYYESRLAKIHLDEDEKNTIDEELSIAAEDTPEYIVQSAKSKWTRIEAIVGQTERLKTVARDIVTHFENRQTVFEGKAMVVAMSRRIAVDLYDEIIKLRPDWHDKDDSKGKLKVIMTGSSSDPVNYQQHIRNKPRRKALGERFKDPQDQLQMAIVRDMWLTGFDVPCLNTMYIDKPMKGHSLMQAIARVNRVFKDKPGGLVVDYIGIASDLKRALAVYTESGGKGDPTFDISQAVALMLEKIEVIQQMMHGHEYATYFSAPIAQKLSIILSSEEHILKLENGKERFVKEVTTLSKAFALAKTQPEATEVNDEVAFFQAIKARLVKFESNGNGKTDEEIETAIRQIVDKAVVSEGVIDVFDAAGIKKPDLSILSDDFLAELKGMKHKNIAFELLRKLLSDEIKVRTKFNLVQSRTLSEMLENAINKYQNNLLSATEIINELIDLAREMREADKRGEKLKLTEDELAFYDALEVNDSAVKILGDDTLRDIARILVKRVRANTTIDWTIKENVKARLKVIVKRVLREYGYPPDKQEKAVQTVLQQAELLAEHWSN